MLCCHSLTKSAWYFYGQTSFFQGTGFVIWVYGTTEGFIPLPQDSTKWWIVLTWHGDKIILPTKSFHISRDSTTNKSTLDTALPVSAEGGKHPGASSSVRLWMLERCFRWQKNRFWANQKSSLCGRLGSAHAFTRSPEIAATNNSGVRCRW